MSETTSDQRPLLLAEEEDNLEDPPVFVRRNHPPGFQKHSSVQSELLDLEDDAISNSVPASRTRNCYRHEREIVVAIFIVAFDTKKGLFIL